ncbi:MAG: right-handed parallel beta-helix repeat-containing protein [Planctomycetes bacterium]|nr:right-handed parallel beta-helix repeat-containing protein [Planctomycetota bacterium]
MKLVLAPSILVAVVACCASASGAVIKVSKAGPITSIQAGVDLAQAGDVVRVSSGVYAESVTIPQAKTGLVLQGKGKVVIEPRGGGGIVLGIGVDVDASGARIKGLTIRHAAATLNDPGIGIRVKSTSVTVEKCSVETAEDIGIQVTSDDCVIRKCTLFALPTGVRGVDTSGLRVESCAFRDCEFGVVATALGAGLVDKCSFVGGGDDAVLVDTTSGGFTVSRCSMKLRHGGAVTISGPDAVVRNCKVSRCEFGFLLRSDGGIVEDCKVTFLRSDFGIIAFDCDDVRITGNRVARCPSLAIGVIDVAGATIGDNRISACGFGLETSFVVNAASNVTCDDVRVDGGGEDAFQILATNAVFSGCTAKNALRDGFDVLPTSTNVRLESCVALRCGAEGIENSADGTELADCVARQNRIDFANDAVLALADITFVTGGSTTPPEID